MFGRTWRIFKVSGIPVQVDTSWIVMAALFVMGFYQTATMRWPDLGLAGAICFALVETAAFFGSVLFHEGAHALVCRVNDIEVRSITLFALGGFTSAHIEEKGPREEFLVAVVGPLSSLLLAAGFAIVAEIGTFGPMVTGSLRNLAFVNLLLGAFNLLPGFPLDGGRVLRSAVWGATKNRRTAARVARYSGQTAGVLMIGFGGWQFARGGFGAIFTIFIGFFLFQAARQAEDAERLRAALEGSRVEDAMAPPPISIPADITLTEALDRFLRGNETRVFPVCEGTRLTGTLTFEAASRVGQHDPLRPVSDAMLPLSQTRVVASNLSLHRALADMEGGALVVDHGGNLVGVIGPNEVQAWAGRSQPLVPPPAPQEPPTPPRPDA
jgi:Zn-dependent protease/CBS domain-containing protein